MPRPKTKEQLLELSQSNFAKLDKLIQSLPEGGLILEFSKGTLNRNAKDVLAHLHQWHLLMIEWYRVGMNGNKPDMPAKGYTWKTLPALNLKIWNDNKDVSSAQVTIDLKGSYNKVQDIINSHSDKEMFEKKRYKWTGSTSLGAYLISNTSSHYDWAYKLIKRSLKSFI